MKSTLKAAAVALGASLLGLGIIAGMIWIGAQAASAKSLTGCYGGAAAGYAVTLANTGLDVPGGNVITVDGLGSQGAAGTVTAGCDLSIDRFVFGAWGTHTWHDQAIEITASNGAVSAKVDLSTSWALGGRVGFMFSPDAMLYAKAAYTRANFGDIVVTTPGGSGSLAMPELDGWLIGAGAELATPISNLYVDASYSFSRYDRASLPIAGTPATLNVAPDVHEARLGLLYRFAFPAN